MLLLTLLRAWRLRHAKESALPEHLNNLSGNLALSVPATWINMTWIVLGSIGTPRVLSDPSISVIKRSEKKIAIFSYYLNDLSEVSFQEEQWTRPMFFNLIQAMAHLSLQEQSWVNQGDSDGQQEESAESFTLFPHIQPADQTFGLRAVRAGPCLFCFPSWSLHLMNVHQWEWF